MYILKITGNTLINCTLQTKPYKYVDTNFKHDAVILKLKGSILVFK